MKATFCLPIKLILSTVPMFFVTNSIAQTTTHSAAPDASKGWHYLLEPYMMFPNMQGIMGLGNLPDVNIDENPGDIFNHLQFGAMLYGEATNNQWTISSDLLYMKTWRRCNEHNAYKFW